MTLDISQDYLNFDWLKSVEYQSATGEGTWGSGHTVNNCTIFDQFQTITQDDLRRTYAGISIRFGEWPEGLAAQPQRGDKFTYNSKTYSIEDVDIDSIRRMQWTCRCYTI